MFLFPAVSNLSSLFCRALPILVYPQERVTVTGNGVPHTGTPFLCAQWTHCGLSDVLLIDRNAWMLVSSIYVNVSMIDRLKDVDVLMPRDRCM